MKTIDLNCDMGELKSDQSKNVDAEMMPFISSCNIACGFHSGSPDLIEQTIVSAIANGVKIGAHPSYNDRENFGRLSVSVKPSILMADLRYQISAVKGMVESFGEKMNHVKPHGALYNDLAKNKELANRFVQLVKAIDPDLKIFALAHSELITACQANELRFVSEAFADRRYQKNNALRSRQFEDAVIHDPAEILTQVDGFLNGEVTLVDGGKCPIEAASICLHSDTPGAVALSKIIYHHLKKNHVEVAAVV